MSVGDRYFVDSNLIIYYVDPSDASKRACAVEWLGALWSAGAGCLSWQVLHEFYWNAVRKMHMDPSSAREVVEDLAHWKPVENSRGLLHQAWYWMDSAQLSYWDALILAAAQRAGARYLLSEDFQADRVYGEVQVLNPFGRSAASFGL